MAGEEPEAAVLPVRRRLWPRVAKWTALTLLGLVALLVALVIGFNSGPGRDFLGRQLSDTTFANGLRIKVARIEGSLYGKARLVGVEAFDTQGRFLVAPEVRVDWRPLAYFRNHIDLRSAAAPLVTLERVPAFKPSMDQGPLLPDLDIDVGRLTIDRLVSEPAVSGERRVLRVDGKAHIADRRAQVTARVDTIAAPGGQGGDRLDLVLDAVPDKNRLALDLQVDAPKSGVITALAGLPDALRLSVVGKGDWAAWNGRIDARLAGQRLAALAVTARNGTIGLRGPAELGRVLRGVPAQLFDATTLLDMTAVLSGRRARLSGALRSDALAVMPDGTVDLAANRFDDLKLAVVLTRPGAIAANVSGRTLRADLTLDGAFAAPRVDYVLTAAMLALDDTVLEGLRARGAVRVDPDRLVIPVEASVARIGGLDTVAGGSLVNVRLDGDLAVSGARILSDNLRIRSDRIDAKAVLLADTARGSYTGALEGRVDNYRIDGVGTFAFTTTADLRQSGSGFALTGTIRGRSLRLDNAGVRDFLGGNATASSVIAYFTDGVIRFSNLRLAAPLLTVTDGRGSYVPGGAIAITANARSTRYGALAVELNGTLEAPRAVLVAKNPGFGIGLANLRATIIGSQGSYRFDAKGDTDYGPLSADVTLVQGRGMTLQVNRGDLAGIGFRGRLQRSAAGPFTGRLDAEGQGLAGVVRLNGAGRYQEALVNLRASDTILPGPARLAIGSAIVDARVVLYERPWIVADVQLAQTRLRNFNLTAGRARVDYRDGRGAAQFLVEGISGVPFRVAGNAQLTPTLWRAALDGRVRGIAFRTASPARIVPGQDGYELLPTRFDFGQGNVRLAGKYGEGLTVQSRLDRMDMAIVNTFLPGYGIGGRATGSLDFAQASANAFPTAKASLSINDFTRTTAATLSQPVDVNLVGRLFATGGDARAVIRRRGAVIGRLVATLQPLGPGAGSWVQRISAAPLGGGIRYNGPAETLWSFVGQTTQTLSGPIAVGADFSGRLQNPQLRGIVRGEGLAYDNQTYGTRLTGMTLSGRFAGDRLQVERLAATAGAGKIDGQGFISLSSAAGYPMDMTFALDDARLARSDALSASATGQLRLSKAAGADAVLSGALRLPEARYELVRQGSAELPELTGVRFKPPRGRPRITGNEPAVPSGGLIDALRLDIALTAPNRLYVGGMGLDSEWSADLRVGGTSRDPRLSGAVDLVRGSLGFAGRRFELQEGRVLFTGGANADPQIQLSATEDIDDVAVTVTASGRALNPQIAFTANPSLPSDEVLSRILFGNSVGQLSPLQAVQLAASLNSLSATGGGLNPLGKLRAATGVARLRILAPDEATGRGTAVAAGRYITNNIYVELITDARGFTATQLDISLSRTLSILSQAGGSGANNFNLRYRKRY
ncbi:autotransporter secretion inner membrane protein TamB [Novosphingobium kunmingense]|uniref:Autotransporter secretion inner membrane protein TamB n=1 Tax=Novosphingobium kunmingense TaxID=1211806 RepID=A0A2N0H3D0_9SPHN|nr:translocation/assembly module TamB domain-containing protein [Novosphingobium kunmingense]PKB13441.1 autotransporter secretion inner membrane protein TamB [Novosphingobium kunmingense]